LNELVAYVQKNAINATAIILSLFYI